MTQVAIAWNGLPFYGARLMRAGIERVSLSVDVLGSKPSVPIEGMEETLGQTIHWIDSDASQTWSSLDVSIPDLFIHTGWNYDGFNALGREVRENGGSVVSMIDNRWKNSIRQWAGAVVFRARYRRWFDAVWVPGASGRRLCRFLGMPNTDIYNGVYGADPDIYTEGPPLPERKKTMLFVGQLIPRKNIDQLVEAFRRVRTDHPEWELRIVGDGEKEVPSNEPGIFVEGFLQPTDVAERMRESRFLVLPSREDHWGLVVHEAALSGCGLMVSENVGAAADLVTPQNGFVHRPNSVQALEETIRRGITKDRGWLTGATEKSRELAADFGPEAWAESFEEIVSEYGGSEIEHEGFPAIGAI